MDDADFQKLTDSVRQAGEIRRGTRKPGRMVRYKTCLRKKLRDRLGVLQAELAARIGVSPRTLWQWEQGRRTPTGPARALLRAVSRNPEAVLDALQP